MSHHLSLILLTPLVGALAVGLWRGPAAQRDRVAEAFAVLSLVVAAPLWFTYDRDTTSYQLVERVQVLPAIGLEYHVGVDGVSVLLVILTTLLVAVTVLSSRSSILVHESRSASVFALEFGVLIAYLALDLLLFLAGWTLTLIAAHRVCAPERGDGASGAPKRWGVGLSVLSSVALLVVVLGLGFAHREIAGRFSFDIVTLQQLGFDAGTQRWVFLALLMAMAACLALALPGVVLRDRTSTSMVGPVLVTGVVVKMGTYSLIRVGLPMLPEATRAFLPLTVGAGGLAIAVTGVLALRRREWTESIAYASASHLALIVVGLFTSNPVGVTGSALHQFNHGVSIGSLWLIATALASASTSAISRGVRALMCVVVLGAAGLPMLSGFVSSFLVMQGVLTVSVGWAAVAVGGLALGAAALLRAARDLGHGPVRAEVFGSWPSRDAAPARTGWLVHAPLVALTVWAGVYPSPLLARLTTGVDRVVARVAPEYGQRAIAECGAAPTPELAKTNAAAAFLQSVPCGPDGKPLEPTSTLPATTGEPSR
ncbi:MAG: hypothetical protein FJW27_08585 [Acidimicrobiia bacterium]|nr:hypothetical protein [Acidimicrobiia bacterium]